MSNATWECPICGETGAMDVESLHTNPHASDHETGPIFVHYRGTQE